MKTITIEIKHSATVTTPINEVLEGFQAILDGKYDDRQLLINLDINSIEALTEALVSTYGDNIECRDSVSGGCYGARTGESHRGLTVYVDSSLFPERFLSSDMDEIVNIETLCNRYGEKIDIDPEAFRELMEIMGIESNSDNTYNYLGDVYNPHALCDAEFEVFGQNDDSSSVVIVKFHCGGDIRGNYSDEVVYKFSDIFEAHSAFYPNLQLLNEDEINSIVELRDQLFKADSAEERQKIRTSILELCQD